MAQHGNSTDVIGQLNENKLHFIPSWLKKFVAAGSPLHNSNQPMLDEHFHVLMNLLIKQNSSYGLHDCSI